MLVASASAGRAIGILERSEPDDFAGILLDHDLHQQTVNPSEALFTGSDVANVLARKISNEIPMLVHSINPAGAWDMQRKPGSAGFDVSLYPMPMLTA